MKRGPSAKWSASSSSAVISRSCWKSGYSPRNLAPKATLKEVWRTPPTIPWYLPIDTYSRKTDCSVWELWVLHQIPGLTAAALLGHIRWCWDQIWAGLGCSFLLKHQRSVKLLDLTGHSEDFKECAKTWVSGKGKILTVRTKSLDHCLCKVIGIQITQPLLLPLPEVVAKLVRPGPQ